MSANNAFNLRLRPVVKDDLRLVMDIQEVSFTRPLTLGGLSKEIFGNPLSHYIVAETHGLDTSADNSKPAGTVQRRIVGYAGMWSMVDEAHVASIAVAPDWRGRGVGARLLISLIETAADSGMRVVTLEVRHGNAAARSLYKRFDFREVGLRQGYYADNGEDAVIMTSPRLDEPRWRQQLAARRSEYCGAA